MHACMHELAVVCVVRSRVISATHPGTSHVLSSLFVTIAFRSVCGLYIPVPTIPLARGQEHNVAREK
jgi:hypothetical protein